MNNKRIDKIAKRLYKEFPDDDKGEIIKAAVEIDKAYGEIPEINLNEFVEKTIEIEKYYRSFPDWYWKKGLHDAEVLSITETELNPDCSLPNPKYNCLEICLDAEGTMFEQDIRKIRFYNYKIKECDVPFSRPEKLWWMHDDLTQISDKRYMSEIEFENAKGRRKKLIITYEIAEVERK